MRNKKGIARTRNPSLRPIGFNAAIDRIDCTSGGSLESDLLDSDTVYSESDSINQSILEPIPELIPKSESVPESELTWESKFAPVTELRLTPGMELAPE